jgi:S-adenosylmethionine hydrolase
MVLTLLTDFGTRDAYVGIMKGVILSIAPSVDIVDLSHSIPPQGVLVGALLLKSAVRYFPTGTIHLAVVDPGVGSSRDAIAVFTDRGILIGPDNGLLHPAALQSGLRETRRIECEKFFLHPVSNTFHGRDIFAPVAAHLAAGVPPEEVGSVVPELTELGLPEPRTEGDRVVGEVIHVDQFGNLVTNIPAEVLDSASLRDGVVRLTAGGEVPIVSAYAEVPEGQPLAIVGSWDQIEISVRNGNAAKELGAGITTKLEVAPRS